MHRQSRHCNRFLRAFLTLLLVGAGLAGCGKQGAASDATGAATNSSGGTGSSGASGAGSSGTGAATSSAGAVIDDTMITTKLKAALLADTTLSGATISVETRNGEVVLTGAVDNPAQREHAAQIARALSGVKNVNNKLAMRQ